MVARGSALTRRSSSSYIPGGDALDGDGDDATAALALVVHVHTVEGPQTLGECGDACFDGAESPGEGVVDGDSQTDHPASARGSWR
jgi:hypothetical protein